MLQKHTRYLKPSYQLTMSVTSCNDHTAHPLWSNQVKLTLFFLFFFFLIITDQFLVNLKKIKKYEPELIFWSS